MNKPCIKYLNIDNKKKFGHDFIVRVIISGKHFVVWTGNDFETGKMVANKVQKLMSKSKSEFLEWYDNNREEWLKRYVYKNANT